MTAIVDTVIPMSAVPLFELSEMNAEVDDTVLEGWKMILATGTFIGGPSVERFEHDWAAYCDSRHAIGVANGTDALEITLRAMGVGPGDEVVVPANTFTATAEAVVMAGAFPRFADVDAESLLLSSETIEPLLNDRTAAIIVVHLYGHMPNMQPILDLASSRGLAIIEDAAQAHGATWKERKAGSLGHAGCFSFYPGKNLGAYGDAGAVVTNDSALAAKVRCLSNHGRSSTSKYLHKAAGRNSRLDALQALVLSAKLARLDGWNRARREAMSLYSEYLRDYAGGLVRPASESISAFHLNVIRVDDRLRVQADLLERGIETDIHYPVPLHRLPFYGQDPSSLPVAEQAADEILSLPLFPHMTSEQIEGVCLHFREVVRGA
jgi:dTDP-4-amino-4,6-dideoxygalactose transaminase